MEPERQAATKSWPLSIMVKDDLLGVRSWETSTWWTLSTALYLLPSYPGALIRGPANISAAKLSPTTPQPRAPYHLKSAASLPQLFSEDPMVQTPTLSLLDFKKRHECFITNCSLYFPLFTFKVRNGCRNYNFKSRVRNGGPTVTVTSVSASAQRLPL